MKITTAAIAERTAFCLCLSFGWRHMPEKATWHQTGTCSSQLLSEHGFDHPAASWEPNDFGTINFCCFLETPGSWSGVGALGWDSTNTFRLWNAFSACNHEDVANAWPWGEQNGDTVRGLADFQGEAMVWRGWQEKEGPTSQTTVGEAGWGGAGKLAGGSCVTGWGRSKCNFASFQGLFWKERVPQRRNSL